MRLLQDRYQVVREVGRGGQGAVYLCEDRRLSGRLWAVKELPLSASERADFEREASLLSQLDHPRIPVVVDFFVQDGFGYLVREFLDGPSLHQWVERHGPVGEAQALQWAGQLAEVLVYLHARKPPLYHRDLKPQNLILLPDGIRLIDFGLAHEGPGRVQLHTGSVSFSAPEQFSEDHRPGPTADIFSLGALLYYLLLGVPPGPTGGEHRLRTQRPELQLSTEELVLQCLEADPARRPQDVEELLHSLQFASMKLPAPTAGPLANAAAYNSPGDAALSSARPSARRLGLALLPLLGVLLALAALVLLRWQRPQPGIPPGPSLSSPSPEGETFHWEEVQAFERAGRWAEAEAALQATLAAAPGTGWAQLGLARLKRLRRNPRLPRVPLLLPLGGQEQEHVNWILQGFALGQQDEDRFVLDLLDTHGEPVLQTWPKLQAQAPSLVLGPFGSQDALLLAPLAAGSGIPVMPIGSVDPRVRDAGPGIFPAAFPHWERLGAMLDHAVKARGPRGAIFYSADSKAMVSSAQVAADHLTRSGQAEPVRVAYAQGDDPAAAVQPIVDGHPDWIYLSDNLPQRAAGWISRLRQAGVSVPVLCVFHPASEGFVEALHESPGQVWLVEPLWQQRNPAFVKRCAETFGTNVADWNNALGYDVARLAGRCWTPRGAAATMQALRASQPYDGLLGRYDLSHQQFDPYPFRYQLIVVESGRRQPGVEL